MNRASFGVGGTLAFIAGLGACVAQAAELRMIYVPSDPDLASVQNGFASLVLNHTDNQGWNVYSAVAQVAKITPGESAEETIQQLVARARGLDPKKDSIGVRRLYNSQDGILGAIDVAASHLQEVPAAELNAFKLLVVQRLQGRSSYFFFQGVERNRGIESTFMAVLDRDHREILLVGSVSRADPTR